MVYWQAGTRLNNDKYIVNEILGSGGFGVTYKITETKTNRLFALKTLNFEAQNRPDFDQLQTKFINEAIALASCPHPNIVRVYPQVFQEKGLWCMVMEYIEGEDLGRYLETNGKFSEAKAIAIITKVGEALSSIHQKGFLHRDIKPGNILLRSSDLTPVLIDFGLAREFISEQSLSMTNAITESFAPIEQYQRHGNFGAWTDVYALAATLYTLVTKEVPFPSRFRTHAELPSPKQHNLELSDRINEAILKGMELEPGDRPQTVQAWLDLLKPPQPKPQPSVPPTYIPEYQQPQSLHPDFKSPSQQKAVTAPVTRRNWLSHTIYKFDVITVNSKGKEINREEGRAKYFTEDLGNDVTLDMVEIPGGTFIMGSPKYEKGREDTESPQHEVTVPSFYMAKFEITQGQWKQVAALPQIERKLESDPSYSKGADLPVEQVSWDDAVEFCLRLSNATGKEYRLPSEAEWEYACRAGTTPPFHPFHYGETITTDLANYLGTNAEHQGKVYLGTYANEPEGAYRAETTPVGSFPPNAFGLYDMHGNVWEWCTDSWHDNYQGAPNDGSAWLSEYGKKKVLRGGSHFVNPNFCRCADRYVFNRESRLAMIGFRVACIAPRTT
jgi:formylglycine-generating enzyme required for sulfatase activity